MIEKPKTIQELVLQVEATIRDILRAHLYDKNLDSTKQQQQILRRSKLRNALKTCTFGDNSAKAYIKEYISDILIGKYKLTECEIEEYIPFLEYSKLTARDQFDILMYTYQQKYGSKALSELILRYQLDQPKYNDEGELYYEIADSQINHIFSVEHVLLDYYDKIQILTQRIYSLYRGNGVIDEIRDMSIDGVSAGVSGKLMNYSMEKMKEEQHTYTYESIWLFFKGKSIQLSFLSFHSEKELIRVCKNIYRYNNPGHLSEVRGYIVNEMMDGCRIAVARPPFCEGWVLFIRKFNTNLNKDIRNIITDNNSCIPIQMLKWLIKGCQVLAITGEQGSGKTTLLMSLIRYISPAYNIRVQELSFELNLRKIYPNRNIVSFKETDSVSGKEGLDFTKKTDGNVTILGEVASADVASLMISMSQVASLFTLFTHHAKTTKDLVYSMRNALLTEGGFHNETAATRQVVDSIQFDIHMSKHIDGHRYIERISQIIPNHSTVIRTEYGGHNKGDLEQPLFKVRDLVVYEQGRYRYQNELSDDVIQEIRKHLSKQEEEMFYKNISEWRNIS